MALITVPNIENLSPATPELWNARYGPIVEEINGNLDSDNIAPGSINAGSLASDSVTNGKIQDDAVTYQKWTNSIKFRVHRAAAWTTPVGVAVAIPMDTKNFDTSSNVDVATNKGRFTVPVSGFYFLTMGVNMASGGLLGAVGYLYKNGALMTVGIQNVPQSAQAFGVAATDFVQLSAGDYIEPYLFTNVAAAANVGSGSVYFAGYLVTES